MTYYNGKWKAIGPGRPTSVPFGPQVLPRGRCRRCYGEEDHILKGIETRSARFLGRVTVLDSLFSRSVDAPDLRRVGNCLAQVRWEVPAAVLEVQVAESSHLPED